MATRNPVVFVYNVHSRVHHIFKYRLVAHVQEIFKQDRIAIDFLPLKNTPTSTILTRTKVIYEALSKYQKPPHVVAFSLAGVEARAAIGNLNAPALSFTSISTPILGSVLGDWADSPARNMIMLEPLLGFLGVPLDSYLEYRTSNLQAMHQQIGTFPIPEASVTSKSAYHGMCPLVQFGYNIITSVSTDPDCSNDGVVAVKEAKVGKHLTTFEMDHTELLGSNLKNNCALVYRLVADNLRHVEGKRFNKVTGR